LVACDVYRPAAIDQLKVLGGQIKVPVYTEEGSTNPSTLLKMQSILQKRTVMMLSSWILQVVWRLMSR
jgi:signal recognition particle GTPase